MRDDNAKLGSAALAGLDDLHLARNAGGQLGEYAGHLAHQFSGVLGRD